ncbi:MAG: hypothetical protein R3A80_04300 [Bdellovibrionota bacterium]
MKNRGHLLHALLREIDSLEVQLKLGDELRVKSLNAHLRKCLHMMKRTREVMEIALRRAHREEIKSRRFLKQITEEMFA